MNSRLVRLSVFAGINMNQSIYLSGLLFHNVGSCEVVFCGAGIKSLAEIMYQQIDGLSRKQDSSARLKDSSAPRKFGIRTGQMQGLKNPLARRPGLVISTFGLAEIISCMPDGLVKKIYIGY
jgi:hypothetical protein